VADHAQELVAGRGGLIEHLLETGLRLDGRHDMVESCGLPLRLRGAARLFKNDHEFLLEAIQERP
jgi:hypothetical protein